MTARLTHQGAAPQTLLPPLRRLVRDAWLGLRSRDQPSYYRAVMRADCARGHQIAVGSPSHESWLRIGRLQFDYLIRHGLSPRQRMLEIGCGDLRAGRLFIDYLEPGNYHAVDLSPEILLAAQQTIVDYGLQEKLPNLMHVRDLTLAFLPADHFDVIHAHSVFPHCAPGTIHEAMASVRRVMAPGGFFDFTFDRVESSEYHVLWEDYYYTTETLQSIAAAHGLAARFMDDWEELPHRQSKLRAVQASDERQAGC
jgi:SAM-dependent methyltransferase